MDLYPRHSVVSYRNSTSNHNQSSQLPVASSVVSYRNSTSNHNKARYNIPDELLYLIEILHQTTTFLLLPCAVLRCILSKFYIKPQLSFDPKDKNKVVSYRNSTSNHNLCYQMKRDVPVVSYRNSTSNHNRAPNHLYLQEVVSYRNSTSNHNRLPYRSTRERVVSYRNSTSNHNCRRAH